MSGLVFVGGIVTGNLWLNDGKENSRNFRQGNRVYDSEGIATALSANSVGGLGGETSLYKVEENKRNGDETLTNTQTSTFEFISEEETVEKKPFKFIDLFSGIGGFHTAFKEVGGECVFASEIDKFAKQAYTTLHGLEPHGDITQIDAKDIPVHDVIAAGFPCQSFSVAGKRGGFEDARGTLFFEVARIASEKQPKVLLLENVKGLVGHDKGKTLDTIVKTLNEIGYRVDFEVLNSKYFGVPQNRERIFIVAIREDLVANEPWNIVGTTVVPKGKRRISGYEDVKTFNFDWPTNDTVEFRLKDVLESVVDEKYYLSEEKSAQLVAKLEDVEVSPTHSSRDYEDPRMVGHANIKGHDALKRVYDPNHVGTTLTTMGGGHREPKIATVINAGDITHGSEKEKEDVRVSVESVGNVNSSGNGMNGETDLGIKVVGNPSNTGHGSMDVHNPTGISPTITARDYKGAKLVAEGLPIREATKKGFAVANEGDAVNIMFPTSKTRRGRVGKDGQAQTLEASGVNQGVVERVEGVADRTRCGKKSLEPNGEEYANALTSVQHDSMAIEKPRLRIRKLTPLECWRLQGFSDEQHNAVESSGISNSQRYKMAGNAVTVNVIEAIGTRLLPYL